MKTHVIQLDFNDDFISIRNKLGWSKAPRILIVWPDTGRIRLLDLDIQLLIKKAENLGAQIAFVCDDPLLVQTSLRLGVPIFSSIPEAQRRPWRRTNTLKRKILQNTGQKQLEFFHDLKLKTLLKPLGIKKWVRWLIFSAGFIAFLTIVGVFIPSANVHLKPKADKYFVTIDGRSNPSITTVNLTGAVPAKIVTRTVSEIIEEQSSGIVRIPGLTASGEVVFRNLSDQPITVPSGVIVSTTTNPIISFETTEEITLSPGVDNEKAVTVTGLLGGVIGNVPAGSIQSVEGEIGGSVLVNNLNPISGGTETKTFAPSESDYETARQKIMDVLEEKAYQEFWKDYPEAFLMPRTTLKLEKIIQEGHYPEIGDPGDRFKLELQVEYSIWMINQNDIEQIAGDTISKNMMENSIATVGQISLKVVSEPQFDETGSLRWQIEAGQEIKTLTEKNKIFQLISGKKIDQAILLINQNYQFMAKPVIDVFPKFWQRIPYLPFRIHFEIED